MWNAFARKMARLHARLLLDRIELLGMRNVSIDAFSRLAAYTPTIICNFIVVYSIDYKFKLVVLVLIIFRF